jgi:hypothetical protein
MSIDAMTLDEMTLDKMTLGKMTLDTNVRLGLKGLPGANTLAYYEHL